MYGYEKNPHTGGLRVDLRGFEPTTFSMPLKHAPNCAMGPPIIEGIAPVKG